PYTRSSDRVCLDGDGHGDTERIRASDGNRVTGRDADGERGRLQRERGAGGGLHPDQRGRLQRDVDAGWQRDVYDHQRRQFGYYNRKDRSEMGAPRYPNNHGDPWRSAR